MTKAEAVDIIYIELGGGKMSSDNNFKRDEIGVYLSAALGTAIKKHIFDLKQMAMQERASGDVLFEKSIPEGFYTTVSGTPEYDEERDVYSLLIDKTMALPYGWGVRNPRAKKNPSADFIRLPNASITSAFESIFAGVYSYWTEEGPTQTTIYFNNLPSPVCEVLVSVITDPSETADTDSLNAPKDVIENAIRLTTDYFRPRPADRRQDDKGTNERES